MRCDGNQLLLQYWLVTIVLSACCSSEGRVVFSEYDLPITRFNDEGVSTLHAGEVDSQHGISNSFVQTMSRQKPLSLFRLRNMFDWFVAGQATRIDPSRLPKSVFCHNRQVEETLTALKRWFTPPESTAGRAFIIGGQDFPQQAQLGGHTLEELRLYFELVRHEQKNIVHSIVQPSPCGLTERYYRGFEAEMFASINNASIYNKKNLGFAAYGYFFANLNVKHYRLKLKEWLRTTTVIQKKNVPRREWYHELSRSKFFIAPLGNGVQTPKVVEALLVLTIPIVEAVPVYVALRDDGWPILVVKTWQDITVDLLEKTWVELSPRLERFRHFVLLNDGFFNYMTRPPEHTRAILRGEFHYLNETEDMTTMLRDVEQPH